MSESKRIRVFDTMSFWTLAGTLFLLPFFFLPFVQVPLESVKGFLLAIGVLLSFSFWVIARFSEGEFNFPRSLVFGSVILLPITALCAGIVTSTRSLSLFGTSFEVDTFFSILMYALLFVLTAIHATDSKKVYRMISIVLMSFIVTLVSQVLLVFVDVPSLAPRAFASITSLSLFGNLSNTAVFTSFGTILVLLSLDLLPLPKWMRITGIVSVVLGLFVLAVFNYTLAWILLGGTALLAFVYSMSLGRTSTKGVFPIVTFIVLLVSSLFIIAHSSLGSMISAKFGMSFTDVRPSLAATFEVAKGALSRDPVFGAGPVRFAHEWALNKPEGINSTAFWNTGFSMGSGYMPTLLVTLGILGMLAWLVYMVGVLVQGFRLMTASTSDRMFKYLSFTSIIGMVYFWAVLIVFVPNVNLIAYTFLFSGLAFGLLVNAKLIKNLNIKFLNDPRKSFFVILVLVVIMIATVGALYSVSRKFTSIIYFNKGVSRAQNQATLAEGVNYMSRAVSLNGNDLYYRVLAEMHISRISMLLSDSTLSEDTVKSEFQNIFKAAEESARNAVAYDRANYQNWLSLGGVYEAVVPLGVQGAYDSGTGAYAEALRLNPTSPEMYLAFARLELANKSNDKAKDYINQALQKKPDYVNGYFFLADMALAAKDTTEAVRQLEKASTVAPNSAEVFLKLGAVRYDMQNYQGAVSAFERSVIIAPNSAEARFLLSLAYQKVGRTDDARTQLELLSQVFPESEDITKALENLNAGRPIVPPSTSADTVEDLDTSKKDQEKKN